MYRWIARAAPARYAIEMLTRAAFDRGDYALAERRASSLPAGDARSEWLARIADARGNRRLALEWFLDAGNAPEVQSRIDAIAQTNVRAAMALENRLISRMQRDGDHPDAVADAIYQLGILADRSGDLRGALRLYRRAFNLAPLNAKYLLTLADAEKRLGFTAEARADRLRAVDIDPRVKP